MFDYEDQNAHSLWDLVVCIAIIVAVAICLCAVNASKSQQNQWETKINVKA